MIENMLIFGRATTVVQDQATNTNEMFDEAVSVHMKAGKSRHEATKIVCRKNPELRAAMVAAHNAEYKPARR